MSTSRIIIRPAIVLVVGTLSLYLSWLWPWLGVFLAAMLVVTLGLAVLVGIVWGIAVLWVMGEP